MSCLFRVSNTLDYDVLFKYYQDHNDAKMIHKMEDSEFKKNVEEGCFFICFSEFEIVACLYFTFDKNVTINFIKDMKPVCTQENDIIESLASKEVVCLYVGSALIHTRVRNTGFGAKFMKICSYSLFDLKFESKSESKYTQLFVAFGIHPTPIFNELWQIYADATKISTDYYFPNEKLLCYSFASKKGVFSLFGNAKKENNLSSKL